jgi:hypothetical protein
MPNLLVINPAPRRKKKAAPRAKCSTTAKKRRAVECRPTERAYSNPTKGKTMKRKKPRTAAQKAATRKMLAANRAKRAPARRPAVRSNPINPTKRRKRRAVAKTYSRRKVRRNPSFRGVDIGNLMMDAAYGAAGATLVNTAMNWAPLPDAIKASPMMANAARAALAIAVGVFGGKFLKPSMAQKMAVGSLTVTAHNMIVSLAAQHMPTMRLGYYSPAYDAGAYPQGTGAINNMNPCDQRGMLSMSNPDSGFMQFDDGMNMGEYIDTGMSEYIQG